MLSTFSCACWPSVYLPCIASSVFRSYTHFSFGLLTFLLLSCLSYLYILAIKPLSVASFDTIFSHSVSCLFAVFLVFFAVQKHVSLIKSHWFIFAFVSVVLEG